MQTEQNQTETKGSGWLKWVVCALLALSVVCYYLSVAYRQPDYVRWGALLLPLFLAGLFWIFSPVGRRFRSYLGATKQEASKVVWPSGQETWRMALVVLAFVVLLTSFVWLVDYITAWVFYDLLLQRKGS